MAVAFAMGEQAAPRGIAIGVLTLVNGPGFQVPSIKIISYSLRDAWFRRSAGWRKSSVRSCP